MPSTSIFSMVRTQNPKCGAIFSKSSALPAPFSQKTDLHLLPQNGYSSASPESLSRNAPVLWLQSLLSAGTRSGCRYPDVRRDAFFLLLSSVLSIRQSEQHRRCGIKSENTGCQSVLFLFKISSKSLLCPKCTPSNLPIATAVSFPDKSLLFLQ